jgi:threonyl-tRNA synthetase
MKILSLHTDYIKFKPLKKALKSVEELGESDKKEKVSKEALVIMTAIEKVDTDVKAIIEKLVYEVKDIAGKVKATNIVLYPYAHLSSNLASPDIATAVLNGAEAELKKDKNLSIIKAPFGYYKEVELKVKGHPLSELSREINLVENTIKGEKGEKNERKVESQIIRISDAADPKQLLRQITKSRLDTSKLKENDHRILGQQMDLYSFSDTAPGMVFFHNNGLIIYNELVNFWRDVHRKSGYQEISTPQILDKKLWLVSGHWQKYKDNIFLTNYENREFAVKPMNCPGGMLVYKSKPKSYKELPLRVGELGIVHRQELSGVLAGLFRVIKFTQDDAHIFCTEEQTESEIISVMDLIGAMYKKLGVELDHVELSTRPEKRIGVDEVWDIAEKTLENVLKKKKMKYQINKGDGSFYGPKIDFHIKDSLGRTWQTATIQLDFAMPERFELEYTDKDGKIKRPVMLHRVVYGSLERFMGVYLEHTNGRLPTWMAPIQVRIMNFTDRNDKYAHEVIKKIGEAIPNVRMDADLTQTTVPSKVKEAELMKVPYIIVVGDREEKEKTLAVRTRGDSKIKSVKIEDFIKGLKKEIEDRL